MRLTLRTNLAARVLMYCAVNQGRTIRSSEIAHRCNASLNHLLQVVALLQSKGFLATQRGRAGGIQLALDPHEISMGQVFRQLEARIPFAECFDQSTNSCPLWSSCRLRGYLTRAVEAFFAELDEVSLHDLVEGNCGLEGLLTLAPDFGARCETGRPTAA